MDVKKLLKSLSDTEKRKLINICDLTLEEYPIAESAFIKNNYRLKTCDLYGISLSTYHVYLNRIIYKIQTVIKSRLFA